MNAVSLAIAPRQPEPSPPDAPPVVEARDLSFAIQHRQLLSEVVFELSAGQLLVVVGCNGAGKTTLLRHLTGELGTGRNVHLFGRFLEEHTPRLLAQRRGVLAQHTHLSFNYEVEEVVLLGRIPHRHHSTSRQDRQIAARALERVGMSGYEHRNYLTLSGGEQQRVQLARVLAQLQLNPQDPTEEPVTRLLMLDEPTASLDIACQHQVLRLSRELCAEGVGVLAILHDLNLAAQYADQVLVLGGGRVIAHGTPFDVLTAENLRAAFGHELVVLPHPCLRCPLIVSAM